MGFSKRNRYVLFVILFVVFGWIVYSPMLMNHLSNPDGIYLGIINRDGDGSAAFGRIGVAIVIKLMASVVSPNLMGIISLIFLGIALCFVAEIFDVKTFLEMGILAALLILSPSMSSQFTYYYCMIQYLLSYLLGVMACYIIAKSDKNAAVVLSAILIFLQLTLYQAFLSVTCAFAVFYVLKRLLENTEIKLVVNKIIKYIISVGVGVVIYVLTLKLTNVQLADTRGFDKIDKVDPILRIKLVKYAYLYFIDYLFGNDYINNKWMHRDWINGLVLFATIMIFLIIIFSRKIYRQGIRLILSVGCFLTLPLCYELMVILAPEADIHGTTGIIMIPAMSIFYMGIIFLWRIMVGQDYSNISKIRSFGYVIILLPVLYSFSLFTAVFENVMWLNYQSTYSLCQKMSYKIDELGGLEDEVQVSFYGRIADSNYPYNHQEIRDVVKGTLAEYGQIWEGGALANHCYRAFYNNYFGIDYNIVNNETFDKIAVSESFNSMPIFPEEGSVIRDGNVIIVKISEIN